MSRSIRNGRSHAPPLASGRGSRAARAARRSLATSLLALSITGCAPQGEGVAAPGEAAAVSHTAAIREVGTLRMVCFPHQANPFVSVNTEMGPMPRVGGPEHFRGIDIELISAFADFLGVDLAVHPVSEPSYARLIPDLLADRGDLVASSFSITAAREEDVDFSDPYYTTHRMIVARRGSPIATLEDLKDKIGVAIPGSTHEAFLHELGLPEERIVAVGFTAENFTEVMEGNADFTSADSTVEPVLRRDFPDLDVALRLPSDDHFGVAVPPGSDLREALNTFLAEKRESGWLDELIARHLRAFGAG